MAVKKISKTVGLSEDVWAALDNEAEETGLNRSVIVQATLKEKLNVSMTKAEKTSASLIGGK